MSGWTPAEEEVLRMVDAGHSIELIAIEMAEEVLRLRSMLHATAQEAVGAPAFVHEDEEAAS